MEVLHFPHVLPEKSLDVLIDVVSGCKCPFNQVAFAAWELGGYVLYKIDGCPHDELAPPAPVSLSPESVKALLLRLKEPVAANNGTVKALDIPWRMIWEIIKRVIDSNLPV